MCLEKAMQKKSSINVFIGDFTSTNDTNKLLYISTYKPCLDGPKKHVICYLISKFILTRFVGPNMLPLSDHPQISNLLLKMFNP